MHILRRLKFWLNLRKPLEWNGSDSGHITPLGYGKKMPSQLAVALLRRSSAPLTWHAVRTIQLVAGFVGALSAMDVSGVVLDPHNVPKSGVIVTLSSTGVSAITGGDGTWKITGGTAVENRRLTLQRNAGHVILSEGRLHVRYGTHDPLGRCLASYSDANTENLRNAARSSSMAPDTLIYSCGSKVFLRDTVSESRTGIIRAFDTTWNASIIYGYITDSRDSQVYRTVRIGSQVWLAQNLNYFATGSLGVCPGKTTGSTEGSADTCFTYGRLYTWKETMQGASASFGNQNGPKGLCPLGFHVPSDAEWTSLETSADPTRSSSATKLKSAKGWNSYELEKDDYGFRALPAGVRYPSGTYYNLGQLGSWWTSKQYDANYAYSRYMRTIDASIITRDGDDKNIRSSIRCLQD